MIGDVFWWYFFFPVLAVIACLIDNWLGVLVLLLTFAVAWFVWKGLLR